MLKQIERDYSVIEPSQATRTIPCGASSSNSADSAPAVWGA